MLIAAVLVASAGCLFGGLVFYVLARRACRTAMATLAEARTIHDTADGLLEKSLDTVARAEELTV